MNDSSMEKFNSLIDAQGKRRWKDCVELISRENIDLTFLGTEHDILRENLLYIRESMAGILAWMLRERLVVGYEDSGGKGIKEICSKMSKANPMNYKNTKLYEKIVKDFLFAAFAGLTGGRPWNGEEQVNGGYIVVKPNGEVLCYHANDREEFRDYLFRSTFIEYVSCKKYRWGFVRKDNQNRYVLPINGSIRFFKDVEQRT